MEQLGFHWTDFHEIWYLMIFRKFVEKYQLSWNGTRITGTLHEDQYTFFIISRSFILIMINVSDNNCWENKNTHFYIQFFLRRWCHLWDNVEIYCRAGQGADDDMAHAHFILYNQEYRHTHKCISYCFSTAKMFTWTRLNVTLYVLCLSRPSSLSSQDELLILPLSVVRTSSATLVPAAADKHPSCKVHYTL